MNIHDQNILELIQRMLGYLGWAAHDHVLKESNLDREEIKNLSSMINSHKKDQEIVFSTDNIHLLKRVSSYFQKEEGKNPGILHTLTGFNPTFLEKLRKLLIGINQI